MQKQLNNGPIDFVIAWVDGNDEKWKNQRLQYSDLESSSVHSFDYQEWGLLPYWFRCVESNAPWVRYIFFVTWGHVPTWLNTDHPKIKVIKHTDYIPSEYLPTFSSHTIELNFHRIPELSERFVYFNDDMYLVKSVKPEFFFKKGMPCDCAVMNPIAPANKNCIANLMVTTTGAINENFNKRRSVRQNLNKWYNIKYFPIGLLNALFIPWSRFVGFYEPHLPTSMLKTTYEEVWDREYDLLDRTCSHKFRDFKVDVNQWIIRDWQIASGRFEPRSIHVGERFGINSIYDAHNAVNRLRKSKASMVCINDHILDESYTEAAKIIRNYFQMRYPVKSKYER